MRSGPTGCAAPEQEFQIGAAMERLESYLHFIREAERLKNVLRTAWGSEGRQESTAEHSWRLALCAMTAAWEYPELDRLKLVEMALLHDMGELYEGDISAALLPDPEEKYRIEEEAVNRVFSLLSEPQKSHFLGVWKEYNEESTPEARLIKALDKAETIIQHNQGKNPPDFDYEFNLEYGKKYFQEDEKLLRLREKIDEDTENRMKE